MYPKGNNSVLKANLLLMKRRFVFGVASGPFLFYTEIHAQCNYHLFFQCPLAKYIWNMVQCSLGVECRFPDTKSCFNVWIKGMSSQRRKVHTVCVAVVLWGIWKARNMACFNHKWSADPSVVMFRVAYWITD